MRERERERRLSDADTLTNLKNLLADVMIQPKKLLIFFAAPTRRGYDVFTCNVNNLNKKHAYLGNLGIAEEITRILGEPERIRSINNQ